MAFDIYGNDLRFGFCEVHPHVGQEYPCSVCLMERQNKQLANSELSRLQKINHEKSINHENEIVFNIDFGGHVMAGLKIINGEIEVVGAMNGYGNGISADEIIITKSNN